jgi:hypothetical protein
LVFRNKAFKRSRVARLQRHQKKLLSQPNYGAPGKSDRRLFATSTVKTIRNTRPKPLKGAFGFFQKIDSMPDFCALTATRALRKPLIDWTHIMNTLPPSNSSRLMPDSEFFYRPLLMGLAMSLLALLLGGCNTLGTLASQISETPLPPRVAAKLYGVCPDCHREGVVPGCSQCIVVQQNRRILAGTPARKITPEMRAAAYEERAGDGLAPQGSIRGEIRAEDAVRIVSQKLGFQQRNNSRLVVDRRDQRNGRNYFVLQGYTLVITDPIQKTGHTATWGWFFVDAQTGTAYEWNVIQDRLVPLQPAGRR